MSSYRYEGLHYIHIPIPNQVDVRLLRSRCSISPRATTPVPVPVPVPTELFPLEGAALAPLSIIASVLLLAPPYRRIVTRSIIIIVDNIEPVFHFVTIL